MDIKIVDNLSQTLLDVISPSIAQAEECRIAVAFLSTGGLAMVEPALHQCLQRNGRLEFLVGLDLLATEPQALIHLYEISQTNSQVALYCFANPKVTAVYHPKLYIALTEDEATIVIGSSNLTEGGLQKNVEANAVIRAGLHEEIVSDVMALYNTLKFHPSRVVPDQDFLSLYREMCLLKRKQEKDAARSKQMQTLTSQFQEKASSLRRPTPTEKDLFGWQKLVFERLPDGPFKTQDIYQFEEEFARYYPQNTNIRPKIRQVLQQLRDLGLIRHVARGNWMKIPS